VAVAHQHKIGHLVSYLEIQRPGHVPRPWKIPPTIVTQQRPFARFRFWPNAAAQHCYNGGIFKKTYSKNFLGYTRSRPGPCKVCAPLQPRMLRGPRHGSDVLSGNFLVHGVNFGRIRFLAPSVTLRYQRESNRSSLC